MQQLPSRVPYVNTADNLADFFTKPLGKAQFRTFMYHSLTEEAPAELKTSSPPPPAVSVMCLPQYAPTLHACSSEVVLASSASMYGRKSHGFCPVGRNCVLKYVVKKKLITRVDTRSVEETDHIS